MEKFEGDLSKLAEACRACLGPLEGSHYALDGDFYQKFKSVACFEVIKNEQFPLFICESCATKTVEAYEFQQVCQETDQIIKSLLGVEDVKIIEDTPITPLADTAKGKRKSKKIKKEINDDARSVKKLNTESKIDELDFIKIEKDSSDDGDDQDNTFFDDQDYEPEKPKKSQKKTKFLKVVRKSNTENPRKLKQFAKENVESVLRDVKGKLRVAKTCQICSLNASNYRALSQHMADNHQEYYESSWCSICNSITEDLAEHSQCHIKELECPFCQKELKSYVHFINHVSRHSVSSYFKCNTCKVAFETEDYLRDHIVDMHPKAEPLLEREIQLKKRIKMGLNRGSRMVQFNQHEVEAVIKKVQAKMSASVNCPICSFNAVNCRALSTHMSIVHKADKPHWCYFCNTLDIEDLEKHKAEMHSEEYMCVFCNKNHKSVTNYIEHLMRHSEAKRYKCAKCEKSFINDKSLEKHQKLHLEVNEIRHEVEQLEHSSDDEKALSDLIHEKRRQTRAKKHSRRGVYDPERSEQDVLEQIKIEIGDSEVKHSVAKSKENSRFCEQCKKGVQNLKRHIERYHTKKAQEPPSLCPQCGKLLKSRAKLNIHLRLHSGIQPYKCTFCPKAFFMNSHLKLHIRTHTKEKPYICQVCAKSFAQTSMLSTHMRIHTGRPHKCTICEQRFCRPSELRIHMRKHTGEKPYVCDQCGRGFRQTSHLMDHRRTHFDERPFQCSYCDKAFKNMTTLKSHEFIHTGKKPFKCSKCSFSCRVSYHLTKHMMTHEGDRPLADKPYACEICTKNFQTKAHLYSHFDRYHNSSQNVLIVEEEEDVPMTSPQHELIQEEVHEVVITDTPLIEKVETFTFFT